jgi:hypothetical protein
VPLHLRHSVLLVAGRDLRGELREEVSDHVQQADDDGEGEEVLHAAGEEMRGRKLAASTTV